jgi:F-type H+-transporting ATPase subunit delta
MSVTRIATRYAKSLLDLAIEQGRLDVVTRDINTLKTATQNRDLLMMLKSPIISADKKSAVMKALFGGMDQLTLAYINLLINKGREPFLPEIAAEYIAQYKRMSKITSVRITTAVPLDAATLEDLRKKLTDSVATQDNVEIETSIDPELIGGYVLEFDNKRYDASVASKLEDLRNEFTKNLYVKEF